MHKENLMEPYELVYRARPPTDEERKPLNYLDMNKTFPDFAKDLGLKTRMLVAQDLWHTQIAPNDDDDNPRQDYLVRAYALMRDVIIALMAAAPFQPMAIVWTWNYRSPHTGRPGRVPITIQAELGDDGKPTTLIDLARPIKEKDE